MPTRTEIIEAGAQVLHDSKCGDHPVSECARTVARQAETLTEAALTAMLPLIKDQLAAEVRGKCEGHKVRADGITWCHVCHEIWPCQRERSALIIEEYEL